jgi:MerR family transcriptional regulator, thiopeptide resistance regulator
VSYAVGGVAEFAGITVRTLHHYDEIGLLSPGERSPNGYRRYGEADLERLQQILYYRELGFSLEEIAAILDDPHADAAAHLRRQHRLLRERIGRLEAMVAAVERAMEAQQMGIPLTPQERFEVFGDFDPDQYAEEAEQRWGDTDAYRESQRRVQRYTKQDWLALKAEGEQTASALAAALRAGTPADDAAVLDLAEAHRQHITKWFYDCSYEVHRGLADMYAADDRFRAFYERIAPGLADYLRDAIHANATQHGH